VRLLLFLNATTKIMTAIITENASGQERKIDPMEIHERIQLTIGIKTRPVG
jgi:hypothetical protein